MADDLGHLALRLQQFTAEATKNGECSNAAGGADFATQTLISKAWIPPSLPTKYGAQIAVRELASATHVSERARAAVREWRAPGNYEIALVVDKFMI